MSYKDTIFKLESRTKKGFESEIFNKLNFYEKDFILDNIISQTKENILEVQTQLEVIAENGDREKAQSNMNSRNKPVVLVKNEKRKIRKSIFLNRGSFRSKSILFINNENNNRTGDGLKSTNLKVKKECSRENVIIPQIKIANALKEHLYINKTGKSSNFIESLETTYFKPFINLEINKNEPNNENNNSKSKLIDNFIETTKKETIMDIIFESTGSIIKNDIAKIPKIIKTVSFKDINDQKDKSNNFNFFFEEEKNNESINAYNDDPSLLKNEVSSYVNNGHIQSLGTKRFSKRMASNTNTNPDNDINTYFNTGITNNLSLNIRNSIRSNGLNPESHRVLKSPSIFINNTNENIFQNNSDNADSARILKSITVSARESGSNHSTTKDSENLYVNIKSDHQKNDNKVSNQFLLNNNVNNKPRKSFKIKDFYEKTGLSRNGVMKDLHNDNSCNNYFYNEDSFLFDNEKKTFKSSRRTDSQESNLLQNNRTSDTTSNIMNKVFHSSRNFKPELRMDLTENEDSTTTSSGELLGTQIKFENKKQILPRIMESFKGIEKDFSKLNNKFTKSLKMLNSNIKNREKSKSKSANEIFEDAKQMESDIFYYGKNGEGYYMANQKVIKQAKILNLIKSENVLKHQRFFKENFDLNDRRKETDIGNLLGKETQKRFKQVNELLDKTLEMKLRAIKNIGKL